MASITPVTEKQELEEQSVSASQPVENPASPEKRDAAIQSFEGSSAPQRAQPKLALIPLMPAASSKNSKQKQQQQKPLEAKQFPIVLGRTNLSQWWYRSCNCQQNYCRLHCRAVAQNIGSLSKVMIQIDTKGSLRIVGKNPHLITVITPERVSNFGKDRNSGNDDPKENDSCRKDDKKNPEKEDHLKKKKEEIKDDHQQPSALREGDILSIGRRDREPWMRFQIIEKLAATNATSPTTLNANDSTVINKNTEAMERIARKQKVAGEVLDTEASQEVSRLAQPTHNITSTQQRNTHHDAELPEWITTTTATATRKRRRLSSSYQNYSTMDTKQQQHHQAMVATLTKAAAAAGAAADADERNKSRKQYRYNSYYNYYNQTNYEADFDAAQRKRRRHTSSLFAPYHHGDGSKSMIRSAEDLFHIGSSRKGRRLHGQHNDPQIHLVFQDYETSARLMREGSRQGRNKIRDAVEPNNGGEHSGNCCFDLPHHSTKKARRLPRTDRNFIGKPKDERTSNLVTNLSPRNTNEIHEADETKERQSKSMGLLSKTYAAALLKENSPSLSTSAQADGTAIGNIPPLMLQGDQACQNRS